MTDLRKLDDVADSLGVLWSSTQRDRFVRFEEWLGTEALEAGGVGPGEKTRLMDRHIADSLMYLALIGPQASSVVDVGSGVGLPGIPIAIARPELSVTLIDRAERRNHLAKRALRVLGIENVRVVTGDAHSSRGEFDVVTFRASLPIVEAVATFGRMAGPDGVGIFALSRRELPKSPPEPPPGTIFTITAQGEGVLDTPAWLIQMQRSQEK